jgi:hypothetical protein
LALVTVSVYVVVVLGMTMREPEVPTTPMPGLSVAAVALALTQVSLDDCPAEIELGSALREQVGSGVFDTLSENPAERFSVPLLPKMVRAVAPTAVLAGTVNITCWLASAFSENGAVGEVLAPVGSPVMFIVTGPANPFCPTTDTVTGALVVPGATNTDGGATVTVKSGRGPELEPPPGHPLSSPQPSRTKTTFAERLMRFPGFQARWEGEIES